MLDETVAEKIDLLRADVAGLKQALVGVQTEVHLLAEMQRRLVEILTPEPKEGGGNQLAMALAKLVQEVERQNRMLDDLAGVLVTFIRDIPGQVSKAVLEGTTGLLAATRDMPGKVLNAVRDALR